MSELKAQIAEPLTEIRRDWSGADVAVEKRSSVALFTEQRKRILVTVARGQAKEQLVMANRKITSFRYYVNATNHSLTQRIVLIYHHIASDHDKNGASRQTFEFTEFIR